MSYTPTTWATGDTVTATKMNKIEQGIAASGVDPLIVGLKETPTIGVAQLDKTFGEIYTAYASGRPVVLILDRSDNNYPNINVIICNWVVYAGDDYGYSGEVNFLDGYGVSGNSVNDLMAQYPYISDNTAS